MPDHPRTQSLSVIRANAYWMSQCRGFLRRLIGTAAQDGPPQDIEAVIDALAGPAVSGLGQAATGLQPLTAADLAALDSAAGLQLTQLVEALRLQHAALSAGAAAERAVREAIDLPQAMRASVHAARGKAPDKGAA